MEPPTYREIIRRLKKEGFSERPSKGDHRRFELEGRKVTVRDQGGDHPSWPEWRSIQNQAGWF